MTTAVDAPLTLASTLHFAILDGTGGEGVGVTPLGIFKVSIIELSRKGQRIALDEYSRLMVLFDPRSKFDPVMRGERSNFPKIGKFSYLQVDIS